MKSFEELEVSHKEILLDYREYLEVKGFAESTVVTYLKFVRLFVLYAGHKPFSAYVVDEFEGYLKFLQEKPCSESYQVTAYFCLKVFFRYLQQKRIVFQNIFEGMLSPKKTFQIPKGILSEEDILRLLDQPDLTTILGVRDKAILELLYATGIRLSELISLEKSDVDFEEGVVRIRRGKGYKGRVLPLGVVAGTCLKKYLDFRQDDCVRLFVSYQQNPLNNNAVLCLIKKYGLAIGKHVTTHTLRRTFATHMIKAGVNLMVLQRMLGHEKADTMRYYVKIFPKDVKQEHQNTHPRG